MSQDGVTVGHTDQGFVTLVTSKDGEKLSLAMAPKRALELAGILQSEAAAAHRINGNEPIAAFDRERA